MTLLGPVPAEVFRRGSRGLVWAEGLFGGVDWTQVEI